MKFYLKLICYFILLILLVICIASISILDSRVTNKLDNALWTVPAKVYARPLELAEGARINLNNLRKELEMLSYEKTVGNLQFPGEFRFKGNTLNIFLRGFENQNFFYNYNFLLELMEF